MAEKVYRRTNSLCPECLERIPAEVYPEPRKLAVQFAYAEKRGIPIAVIAGSDERAKGVVNLKDLRSRESFDDLSLEDATARASALLR